MNYPTREAPHRDTVVAPSFSGHVLRGREPLFRRSPILQKEGAVRHLGQVPPVREDRGLAQGIGEKLCAFAMVCDTGPHFLFRGEKLRESSREGHECTVRERSRDEGGSGP